MNVLMNPIRPVKFKFVLENSILRTYMPSPKALNEANFVGKIDVSQTSKENQML